MLQSRIGFMFSQIAGFPAPIFPVTAAMLFMSASSVLFWRSLVKPCFGMIFLLLRVPARKETAKIFRVTEIFTQNRRRIGISNYILAKIFTFSQHIVDECSQEQYIGTGTQRHPDISHCRSPGETWIDMNDLGLVLFPGLHHPLEPHRMVFRHVGSHDQDCVCIDQVLLGSGGPAASE